jgi:hypothetical protein
MTHPDEMQQRIERAMEHFERDRMKPWKLRKWSKVQRDGVRLPMRKPVRANLLRVWCGDDSRGLFD